MLLVQSLLTLEVVAVRRIDKETSGETKQARISSECNSSTFHAFFGKATRTVFNGSGAGKNGLYNLGTPNAIAKVANRYSLYRSVVFKWARAEGKLREALISG